MRKSDKDGMGAHRGNGEHVMFIRRFITVLAIVACTAAPMGAAGPKTKYERVLAQEQALRLGRKPSPLSQIRKVVAAYETVARQHPVSGYADNALWQGAELSLSAHRIYQSDVDRATAARLLQWLLEQYPHSSLKPQATQALRKARPAPALAKKRTTTTPTVEMAANGGGGGAATGSTSSSATSAANLASVKALAAARAEEEAALKAETERLAAEARAEERRVAERLAAEKLAADRLATERLAAQKAEAARVASLTRVTAVAANAPARAASGAVTLKDVSRTTVGDLVRVTMEFDGEPEYKQERIEGPSRLFFDLKRIQTAPALEDAVLTYNDTSVKNIRLGRPRQDTTRLVIDLEGVEGYSVFELYNPYRLNVDLRRAPGAPTPVLAKNLNNKPETTLAAAPVVAEKPAAPAARLPEPERRGTPRPSPHPLARISTPAPVIASREVTELEALDAPLPLLASAPSIVPTSVKASLPPSSPHVSAALYVDPRKNASARRGDSKPPEAKLSDIRQPVSVAKVVPAPTSVRQPVTVERATTPPPPTRAGMEAAAISPAAVVGTPIAPPSAPAANASGSFSMARQLGLGVSRIVIDAGHGGHDPGSLGSKVQEKDVVLDVALRLEKLLKGEPGFDVIMTRRTDVFIPLEERPAIANRNHADLFLSIHANSSRNKGASGVETYFLNFASNPEAEEVAARENAGAAQTMNHLPEIIKAITLNNKLDESRDLAHMVQDSMVGGLKAGDHPVPNRGVKQAPLIVLIGAGMPAILAEIAFISNTTEGSQLKTGAYRQKIAESLFAAVKKYQRSLKNVGTVTAQRSSLDDDNNDSRPQEP